jgi:hypothetical protein
MMLISRLAKLIAIGLLVFVISNCRGQQGVVFCCGGALGALLVSWVSQELVVSSLRKRRDTSKIGVEVLTTEAGKEKLKQELARAKASGADVLKAVYLRFRMGDIRKEQGERGVKSVVNTGVSHISGCLREVDWIARMGPEDLLVVLPHGDHFDHAALADWIRANLSYTVPSPNGPITVSAFVCVLDAGPTQTVEEVLKTAVEDVVAQSAKWIAPTAESFIRKP